MTLQESYPSLTPPKDYPSNNDFMTKIPKLPQHTAQNHWDQPIYYGQTHEDGYGDYLETDQNLDVELPESDFNTLSMMNEVQNQGIIDLNFPSLF